MMGEGGTDLSELEAAVGAFLESEVGGLDLKRFRVVIDSLEGRFAAEAHEVKKTGRHLADGAASAVSWIGRSCGMSSTSVADRVCVGEQLAELPRIAEALRSGEISYQKTALLCHLRDKLEDKRDCFDEEEMLGHARNHTVANLRFLCRYAWHVANPDGFFNEAEADFGRRRLHISQASDGMYVLDAVLDPLCGASVRTALESLARRRGPEDDRDHKQRMADALGEAMHHAMDEGRLPRRRGVRPHIALTTTLEGLKQELGAAPAELELALPISVRSLERMACDCTMARVLLADSMVIDVGRATRTITAPMGRALRVRDRGCRFPGCDRQVSWSSPHHIVAWARGGPSNLGNLVLLCYFHHRLVHEGGWQVIRSGREFRFLPPERVVMRRARGPGMRWAA